MTFGSNLRQQSRLIFSKTYWWLIPLYILPQVLHTLLTLLLLPTFAFFILQDAALEGIKLYDIFFPSQSIVIL
jgi:hypothetical protein